MSHDQIFSDVTKALAFTLCKMEIHQGIEHSSNLCSPHFKRIALATVLRGNRLQWER